MTGDTDVYDVRGDGVSVHARSTRRLPFEPSGRMLAFRNEIRAGLQALHAGAGQGLLATYGSPDTAVVDVENVALYNVGLSAYNHLTAEGLLCRREPSPDALHHLCYEVGPLTAAGPAATDELARMRARTRGVITAGTVWGVLRPAVRVARPREVHTGSFVVDLTVHGHWSGPGIAALVKPVLDGLISALHAHDGSHRARLLPRLGTLGDPEQVWGRLTDDSSAVLGTRALLRPHGDRGIAWNPADDRCTAFSVRQVPSESPALDAVVRIAP